MAKLDDYYNKFNEDKRLLSRHGQVEFSTTMHYIEKYIDRFIKAKGCGDSIRILDIGAGTGRYSIALAKDGHEVTAVEVVKHNLGMIKKNAREMLAEGEKLEAYWADARKLKRFADESFDIVILLGPMYHLHSFEDKLLALKEAKRVLAGDGYLFAGYVMADYALIRHGFMDHNIEVSMKNGMLDEDYSIKSDPNELYDYVRVSDMDKLNEAAGLKRDLIISPDGAADYIRNHLNEMSEKEFEFFLDYQMKNAHRSELVGAGSHTVDILVK